MRLLLLWTIMFATSTLVPWHRVEAAPQVLSKGFMKSICRHLVADGWGVEAEELLKGLDDRFGKCKSCRRLNRKFYFACRTANKKKGEEAISKALEPSVELLVLLLDELHALKVALPKDEFAVLSAFIASGLAGRDTRSKSYFGIMDKYLSLALQHATTGSGER